MTLALLQEQNQILQAEVTSLRELVGELQQALQWANAKYDALEKKVYGSSSERITQEQLKEFLPGLELVQGAIHAQPQVQTVQVQRTRQPLEKAPSLRCEIPAHLERRRVEVPAPQEVQDNPQAWEKIGQEVSERLGLEPAKLYCQQLVVGKYRSRQEGHRIVQSPVPATLGDKCKASPEVGAHIVLQKFDLHQPYHRQCKHWREAFGIKVSETTFEGWGNQTLELLAPVADRVRLQVLSSDYLQIDETPVDVLDPRVRKTTATGQMIVYSKPGAELFVDWQMSRAHHSVAANLKHFSGSIQSDGYSIYETVAKQRGDLKFLACWAHVRRKFVAAMDQQDPLAAWFVAKIQTLYDIETTLREDHSPPEQTKTVRQQQSLPLLAEIKARLDALLPALVPKSPLGKAVLYAHKLWDRLTLYVEHGQYHIDNNGVENAIRPTALGKKNWLFVGDPAVGHRHAAIYTLLGSARRLGINPHHYIPDIVRQLCGLKVRGLHQLDRLTPSGWLKSQNS